MDNVQSSTGHVPHLSAFTVALLIPARVALPNPILGSLFIAVQAKAFAPKAAVAASYTRSVGQETEHCALQAHSRDKHSCHSEQGEDSWKCLSVLTGSPLKGFSC